MGVYIRYRKVSNGKFSAYLDTYKKGKRKNIFTDIFVTEDYSKPLLDRNERPKKNDKGQVLYPKAKPEDKEKLAILERLKLEMEVDLASNKFAFIKEEKKVTLLSFMKQVASTKPNPRCYSDQFKFIEEYVGPDFALADFNEQYLKNYYVFLRKKGLGENTVLWIHSGINAALNQAVRDKLIPINPKTFLARHEIPTGVESNRMYLTLEELRKLKATPFHYYNQQVADAFLFSCLTGLRISDLSSICHSDIKDGILQYRQKKSKKQFHHLPLSKEALEIINKQERCLGKDKIFWKMKCTQYCGNKLKKWGEDAGIDKHITWHIGRHTHATILLNQGVDIYLVSKLLGHANVSITEKYAKVINRTKRDAIDRFPKIGL